MSSKHPLMTLVIALIAIFNHSCGRHDSPALRRLDEAVARSADYTAATTAHIDSIRRASYPTPYLREMALQEAMASYSLDSAIYHCREALDMASSASERVAATLSLAGHYNTSGVMYKEASDLVGSIARAEIDRAGLTFAYYSLQVQLNRNLATHSLDPDLRAHYMRRKVEYRDSALLLDPDNQVLLANRYIDSGDYDRAIAMLSHSLDPESTTRDAAIRFNILAQVYTLKGDREAAADCLARSALCDLSNGVREYLSLQQLAMLLYESGDYTRAYNYINRSIADATACNAKQRMLEMSTMLPIIESANRHAQARSTRLIYVALGLIGLLAASLGVALTALHRRNRAIATESEERLALNHRLRESDHIKQEYLTRFMNLCLEYLAQMESYRRELLRIAAHRNFDDLCKAIQSERYIGKGINDFLDKFDEAFLNIFPTFIDDLRAMLSPDYTLRIKPGELLNTELRIVALIRLGFSDSESICRFLRCSPSTVYNYRTRLRSMALNRESFDEQIKALGRP